MFRLHKPPPPSPPLSSPLLFSLSLPPFHFPQKVCQNTHTHTQSAQAGSRPERGSSLFKELFAFCPFCYSLSCSRSASYLPNPRPPQVPLMRSMRSTGSNASLRLCFTIPKRREKKYIHSILNRRIQCGKDAARGDSWRRCCCALRCALIPAPRPPRRAQLVTLKVASENVSIG